MPTVGHAFFRLNFFKLGTSWGHLRTSAEKCGQICEAYSWSVINHRSALGPGLYEKSRINHREQVMSIIFSWSLFCFLLPGPCLTSLHGGQWVITWNESFSPHIALLSQQQVNNLEYSVTGNFMIERPGEMWMTSWVWHMASWGSLKYLL